MVQAVDLAQIERIRLHSHQTAIINHPALQQRGKANNEKWLCDGGGSVSVEEVEVSLVLAVEVRHDFGLHHEVVEERLAHLQPPTLVNHPPRRFIHCHSDDGLQVDSGCPLGPPLRLLPLNMTPAILDLPRTKFKRIRGGRGTLHPDFSPIDEPHSQGSPQLLDDLDGEEHARVLRDGLVEVDLDAAGERLGYLVQIVLDLGEGGKTIRIVISLVDREEESLPLGYRYGSLHYFFLL